LRDAGQLRDVGHRRTALRGFFHCLRPRKGGGVVVALR
jgi:hypothetical protein